MFKKDLLEEDGEVSVKSRRENTKKRIEEYERFEANCEKIRRLNKSQRAQVEFFIEGGDGGYSYSVFVVVLSHKDRLIGRLNY